VGEVPPAPLFARPVSEPAQDAALSRARAALETARTNLRAPFRRPSDVRDDETDVERRAPTSAEVPAQRLARAVGVLAHDALERWDFRDAGALRRLAHEAAQRAARRDALDAAALEREADSLVESILASDLPKHLARIEVLGREVPVLFRDDDADEWSGTIDLLYRDPDGQLVIADYKTDRAPDAEARHRYAAQLGVYARAVARALSVESPPAVELIFVRTGRRERLPLQR
jgi:ATP-dependent helicase/nuclease subunit A